MSTGKRRVFNREFKLAAIQRLMSGASATALAQELQIRSSHLSKWWSKYRHYGPAGLRPAHRPRNTEAKLQPLAKAKDVARARRRVSDLERKIGQQQVELDFFREALRQVGQARRPSDGPGAPASTPPSRR
jgi:transposase